MSLIELKIPDIGGHSDVNVAEVYVKVGDKINVDDNLLMLETDKATMEVPAEAAGMVREVLVQVGSKVNEGDVVIKIEAAEGATAKLQIAGQQPKVSGSDTPVSVAPIQEAAKCALSNQDDISTITTKSVPESSIKPALDAARDTAKVDNIDEAGFAKAFASPSIRKLGRELGVDLGKVKGSGEKGRITEEDVKAFVKGIMTNPTINAGISSGGAPANGSGVGLDLLPWPKVDFAKFGEVEYKEMSRIKKISSANMARNWVMIPHVTVFENADITEMEEFRKQLNEENKKAEIKVTPLAFLIKSVVVVLKKFPEFNASLDGENIAYKNYYNIGFAADTPNGLTVPVIKDADKKGLLAIAEETSALAKAARDGKLKPTDMQGGTFTVSSLGGLGSTAFTPIINAPEVAILGVSKSAINPVWNGKEFIPRLILPLCLSFDHRIIDGALATKFISFLSQILSDLRKLAL